MAKLKRIAEQKIVLNHGFLDRATAAYPIVVQRSQWVQNLRKGLRNGGGAIA
jgi:hypothetical protein